MRSLFVCAHIFTLWTCRTKRQPQCVNKKIYTHTLYFRSRANYDDCFVGMAACRVNATSIQNNIRNEISFISNGHDDISVVHVTYLNDNLTSNEHWRQLFKLLRCHIFKFIHYKQKKITKSTLRGFSI